VTGKRNQGFKGRGSCCGDSIVDAEKNHRRGARCRQAGLVSRKDTPRLTGVRIDFKTATGIATEGADGGRKRGRRHGSMTVRGDYVGDGEFRGEIETGFQLRLSPEGRGRGMGSHSNDDLSKGGKLQHKSLEEKKGSLYVLPQENLPSPNIEKGGRENFEGQGNGL